MTVDSLQESTPVVTEPLPPSAGALLRGYREALGIKPEALASKLHVPVSKLLALEQDRLEALPDAMFARALALAVCRQLNHDAAPVLARLPVQDVSKLATHNERGLDFPLKRPSLLPASGLRALLELPRWQQIVVALLVVAALVMINPWGEGASTDWVPSRSTSVNSVSEVVVPLGGPHSAPQSAPGAPVTEPVAATLPSTPSAPTAPNSPTPSQPGTVVLTPLQPSAVVLTPVSPTAASEGVSK